MPIIVDGKKIIPAPLISISNEAERKPNSQKKRDTFTITVTGTIVAFKGSPDDDGVFYTGSGYPADTSVVQDHGQTSIQTKIGALTELFNGENKWFEASGWDGEPPIKFLFRKKSISFESGPWVQTCRYTVVLECECIYFGDKEICAAGSVDELVDQSWDIEATDETNRTYRLTHTASAQFMDSRNTDGTLNVKGHIRAREAVITVLGINGDRIEQSGVLNLDSFVGYNHNRVVSENVAEGSYRVVETWICISSAEAIPCIEDYTLTISENNGILTSKIDGSINGFYTRNGDFTIATSKLTNANAKWAAIQSDLFTRCQSATERILNPVPVTRQKATNVAQGIISYSYEYNTRSNFGITGAKQVNVSIADQKPTDVFAAITVINRIRGPILQSIGTVTQTRRTISIDVIMNPTDYGSLFPPTGVDVSSIIVYYTPSGYSQYFLAENSENFLLSEGRYQRTVSYVVQ